MRCTVPILALTVVLAACAGLPEAGDDGPIPAPSVDVEIVEDEEWVSIATVSGIDLIGQTHVQNTLEAAGVPCAMGGSVLYGVQVPRSHADRAAAMLRADTLAPVLVHWPPPEEPVWVSTPVGLGYDQALVQFAEDAVMLAVLREPHTVKDVARAPRIVRLDRHVRRYRASDGVVRDGSELRLYLDAAGGRSVLSFMCLAGGAQLRFTGSNAWGAAAR